MDLRRSVQIREQLITSILSVLEAIFLMIGAEAYRL